MKRNAQKNEQLSGCRKRRSAKEVRSLVFVFRTLSVTFWSLFLMLLPLFSSLFCQTPFARLLLRKGKIGESFGSAKPDPIRFKRGLEKVSKEWVLYSLPIFVTGKSLDSSEKGNVDKTSEKCQKLSKIVRRG